RSLLVDAPALIALAALGWKGGAWLAVGWRAVVLAASARTLLDRAPRAAADLLSVLLLTAPVSCEMAARATYLKKAWDAERLVADSAPATGWRDPEPFWSGTCGPPAARESHGVLFAGGSSTGGAYQFVDEPEAFFPTQAHERLCAALPEVAFTATNFGGGGRDTFTISRTIERLMERAGNPDVVVLYTGVNDLAGTTNPKTRKQREADEAARGEAVAGAVSLATRSRVLTGLSLWSRSRGEARAASVPEVPLPDAEENLRRVAAATAARGAQLLLVTEFATVQADPTLLPYARMEARLAEELDGVEYFDVRAALAGVPETELLIDQNHLTREGAARVGAELATVIARMLGYP
ncbi:MAG: GDSL-type esterase/lipase family protein, partial [Myxococcota bacterium]